MICQPCQYGADLTDEPAPVLGAVLALAVDAHGRCRGGSWCDCQHHVVSREVLAARRAARLGGGLSRIVRGFGGAAAATAGAPPS